MRKSRRRINSGIVEAATTVVRPSRALKEMERSFERHAREQRQAVGNRSPRMMEVWPQDQATGQHHREVCGSCGQPCRRLWRVVSWVPLIAHPRTARDRLLGHWSFGRSRCAPCWSHGMRTAKEQRDVR